MPEPEIGKKRNSSEEVVAAADATIRAHLAAAEAREEHGIELLEQISKQLDSIEQLLRERLVK
jgi:hypothetical protein